MQRIAIIVNMANTGNAPEALPKIMEAVRNAGLSVLYTGAVNPPRGSTVLPAATREAVGELAAGGVEAFVSLGGDGTMLKVAQLLGCHDIPLLGINCGTLGYLTGATTPAEIQEVLRQLANGTCKEERRTMLASHLTAGGAGTEALPDALNEVVMSRNSGRLVWIEMLLDGEAVATYACDGMIVATPTGSTAYALSLGGPIVMPQTPALVVCPIGPHTLSSRPLVVPDTAEVTLRVVRARTPLMISVDGNDLPFDENHELRIRKRPQPLRILFRHDTSAAAVLREKLGWEQRIVSQGPHLP